MSASLLGIEDHVLALQLNQPSGRIWAPKWQTGTLFNSFLRGLADTYRTMDMFLERFIEQQIPTTTEVYLAEWERALGLPDDCLPIAATVAGRQLNIEIKLAVLAGVSTEADFVALAAMFGIVVQVHSGIEHVTNADGGYQEELEAEFPGDYVPIKDIPVDYADVAEARHTMLVIEEIPAAASFTYSFPIEFTTEGQQQMRCLFTKLKPAYAQIEFDTKP